MRPFSLKRLFLRLNAGDNLLRRVKIQLTSQDDVVSWSAVIRKPHRSGCTITETLSIGSALNISEYWIFMKFSILFHFLVANGTDFCTSGHKVSAKKLSSIFVKVIGAYSAPFASNINNWRSSCSSHTMFSWLAPFNITDMMDWIWIKLYYPSFRALISLITKIIIIPKTFISLLTYNLEHCCTLW